MKKTSFGIAFGCLAVVAAGATFRTVRQTQSRKSAEHHFAESDRLQKAGQLPEAIQEMKLAIADDPKYYEARQGLADMYESEQHDSEAATVLEEGIQAAPTDELKYAAALSDIYKMRGDYDHALTYLRRSIQLAPDSLTLQKSLPMLLESAHRWDDARQAWLDLKTKFPNDTSADRGLRRIERLRAANTQTKQTTHAAKPTDASNKP